MNDDFALSPSILAADFASLGNQVRAITEAGCDYVHIDVMDGHFVPNISFGAPVMKSLDSLDTAPYDVHLMIEDPDRYIKDFVTEKTEIITVHQEACKDIPYTLSHIKSYGVNAGLSIKPATPVERIRDVLDKTDLVLVMSVEPGFGGQSFMPDSLSKIEELDRLRREGGFGYRIEVDGGIDPGNIQEVVEKGSDIVVAGSSVFRNGNIEENIKKLKEAVL